MLVRLSQRHVLGNLVFFQFHPIATAYEVENTRKPFAAFVKLPHVFPHGVSRNTCYAIYRVLGFPIVLFCGYGVNPKLIARGKRFLTRSAKPILIIPQNLQTNIIRKLLEMHRSFLLYLITKRALFKTLATRSTVRTRATHRCSETQTPRLRRSDASACQTRLIQAEQSPMRARASSPPVLVPRPSQSFAESCNLPCSHQ